MFGFQVIPTSHVATSSRSRHRPGPSASTPRPPPPPQTPTGSADAAGCRAGGPSGQPRSNDRRASRARPPGGTALALCWPGPPRDRTLPSAAAGLQPIPKLTARVTDLTGTLTAEQQTAFEQKLAAFESARARSSPVLLCPPPNPRRSSSTRSGWWSSGSSAGKRWMTGRCLSVRRTIVTCASRSATALEGVLTDGHEQSHHAETSGPPSARGITDGAIDAGLDQMMKLIEGEPLPPPEHDCSSGRRAARLEPLAAGPVRVFVGSVVLARDFSDARWARPSPPSARAC